MKIFNRKRKISKKRKWLINLGNRIKEERINNELTQLQLAKMVGVSESHISEIERAVSGPSVVTLIALAKSLNTTVDYLLSDIIKTNNRKTIERFSQLIDGTTPSQQRRIINMVTLFLKNELED